MGLGAVGMTFAVPSDAESVFLFGFSRARLILGLLTLLAALLCFVLASVDRKTLRFSKKEDDFVHRKDNVYFTFVGLQALLFADLWLFQFTWLFVPVNFRPLLIWGAAALILALILYYRAYGNLLRTGDFREKYRLFPRLSDLDKRQKRTLLILLILCIIYVIILMPSNLEGSRGPDDFRRYGGDEYVIYPILENVLRPGENFSGTLYHHYIHEDYHYGYPFYAWSGMVMMPLYLVFGSETMEHIEVTLPVLRVMVSVVPLMAACIVLVYLATRFRSPVLSAAVYVFLLTAPGSLQNNQGFWHPDGLNLFFVCCTLYFLQRDCHRYGRNFFLAAVFAGLSAATRLYGFFFFLAVGVYLLDALNPKILTLKQMIVKGAVFILVMGLTIIWADPFLLRADARSNMLKIMAEKTGEMSSGYNGDFNDPKNDYRPGWDAWYPAFEDHYTEMYCFFFLIGSLLAACFMGEEQLNARMMALWWIVIAVYLIWFVAVKSTQYVLPMMLPLMSCIFALPGSLSGKGQKTRTVAMIVSGCVWLSQLVINLIKIAPRF